MKLVKTILLSFIAIAVLSTSSCKKSEGEGGKATITGKIWIKKYMVNNTGTGTIVYSGEYAGAYEDVYIIYGDDATYGERIETNGNGVYEFKYLRLGSYKIYAYSSGPSLNAINRVAVMKEVEITEKKQTVDAGKIEIAK